jgi:hypothetical protein
MNAVVEKAGAQNLRRAHAVLRESVIKLDALDHYHWLQYVPRLPGRVPFSVLARQMAEFKAALMDYWERQKQLWVRYILEHPPTEADVFGGVRVEKAGEIEGELRFHFWIDDVVARRAWWDDETMSVAEDVRILEGLFNDYLTEAVGQAGEAAMTAEGVGKAGWNKLTGQLARKFQEWGVPGTDRSAEALRMALKDRALYKVQGAYLGDGAGRLIAAATWSTDRRQGLLIVRYLGTQDALVPGAAAQAVRELAGEASRRGLSLAITAGDETASTLRALGFIRQGPHMVMAADEVGGLAAGFTETLPGWIRPGFLEGPARTFTANVTNYEELLAEVYGWTPGINQTAARLAVKRAQVNPGERLAILRGPDASLHAVANYSGPGLPGEVNLHLLGAVPGKTGAGREMMRRMAKVAADEGRGLGLHSARDAVNFYRRLGIPEKGTQYFSLTQAEAQQFASGLTGGGTGFHGGISWDLAVEGSGDWMRQHKIRRVVDEIDATTHQNLVETLAEGREQGESVQQLAQRVQQLDQTTFSYYRGERIARTEILTANRYGRYVMARENGATSKRWRSKVGDPRTREWHEIVNRQEVPIDQNFRVPNKEGDIEELFMPGVPGEGRDVSPGNIINCRCLPQFIKVGVTDERAMRMNQHGLAGGVRAPGPLFASIEEVAVRAA